MKKKLVILLTIMSAGAMVTHFETKETQVDDLVDNIPNVPTKPELDELTPELELDGDEMTNEEILVEMTTYLKTAIAPQTNKDFKIISNYQAGEYNIDIDWKSDNEEVVKIDLENEVINIFRQPTDQEVNLTMTLSLNGEFYEDNITINVERLLTAQEALIQTNLTTSQRNNYYSVTSGLSIAPFVEQEVNNITYYYEDNIYATFLSESSFVKFSHQALYKGDKVAYAHNSSKASFSNDPSSVVSKSSYVSSYGLDASSSGLDNTTNFTGYVLNENTITSDSKFKSYEDGIYTYEYVLNHSDTSTTAQMGSQMKVFGGLTKIPTFSEVVITINIDCENNLFSFSSNESYVVTKKVFISANDYATTQSLTTYLYNMDETNLPTNYTKYITAFENAIN